MKNNLILISLLLLFSTTVFSQTKKSKDKKTVTTDTTKIEKKDSVTKKIEVIEEVEIMEAPPETAVETEGYEYNYNTEEAIEMDDYEYYGDEMEATIDAPAEYYAEEATEDDYGRYMNTKFWYDTKLKPIDNPDKQPTYSLGNKEMFEFFSKRINCPYNHSDNSSQIVIIELTVGKDSKLYNPKILSTPGANFTRNAENVIKQLPGTFNPGTKNGKPVDSVIRIPVRFDYKLSNNRHIYSNY